MGVLDEPLDVRWVEARNLMEVVDAQPIQRAFDDRVHALESLKVVAWSERLHHDPRWRPRFAARLHLELGLANSIFETVDVVEHALVNPVKHLELGPQALTPRLGLPQCGSRLVTLLNCDTELTP